MAKTLPKASSGLNPVPQEVSVSKTPAGVWVIVGLAVFFVIAGLGVAAFIVWKSMRVEKTAPALGILAVKEATPVSSAPVPSNGEVGVKHPSSNPTVEVAGPTPPVVSDRAEEDRTRQEVLKRIDLMKVLTDAEKDKLYVQVERARGFTKIAILPFSQNKTTAGASQVDGLIKSLKGPHLQSLLADPTVVLIMIGYADKQGDETKNLDISRRRAESVVQVLREKLDLVNLMHPVALGSQDLFDPSDLEKNRVVEVWAVQP
jgi:outer membrane protein OmpA-like peptidoglycan-associated protein